MKHGSLISPDEATFGFGTPKAVIETASAASGDAADFITIPDAHLLFSGEFKHSGNDLKIVGEDGKSFLVKDYFKTDKHPTLRSPEGATLSGDLVDLLAGPLAPGQYAQAGSPQPGTAEAVGRVAVVTGNVTIIRNGVAITVNAGDAILKNDVVQTGAGATIGLSLNDGSTFNLTANARLAINEFVYDPNGTANASLTTLIQGAATFVAGQIAKTGDMKVATPVATMGIRGTAVVLDINAIDGRVTMSIVNERDGRDHIGEVFDRAGNLIATVTSNGGRLTLTPTATLDVIASFTNKTPDMIALEFAAFQAVLTSYEAAKQWFPNLPDRADASPKGTQNADGTQLQPSDKTAGLPDSNLLGSGKITEIVITKPADSPGTGPGQTPSEPNLNGPGDPVTLLKVTVLNGIDNNAETFGPNEGPGFQTTDGVDWVFAGGGDDTIIAGHGGGNDRYDGGQGYEINGDTIRYTSAVNGVVFDLNVETIAGVKYSTADDPTGITYIGHDVFYNIENIVAGNGNDVFILHSADNWVIDAGEGFDIIKLVAGLNVYGEGGPEVSNFEMVDLTNAGGNIVQFDGGAIDEDNPDQELRIVGDSQDIVGLTPGGSAGHWELVSGGQFTDSDSDEAPKFADHFSDGVVFDTYIFVDDYGCTIATAYIDKDIKVQAANDDVIANASPSGDGWVLNEDNGHYYRLVNTVLTWDAAKLAAAAQGAYLATITSASEQTFVTNVVGQTRAWLGGYSDTTANANSWHWVTGPEAGMAFDYAHWRPGEPNGWDVPSGALHIEGVDTSDGGWNDAPSNAGGRVYVEEWGGLPNQMIREDIGTTLTKAQLLANDVVRAGDVFTVASTSARGGVITIDENNIITYVPAANDFGADSFTYTLTDANGVVSTGTVSFEVAAVNDAPEISWSPDTAHTPAETPLLINGMAFGDSDAAAGEQFTLTVSVHHGSIIPAFNPANFHLTQVPIAGDDNDPETPLPYQWSFTGSLADINAALASSASGTGFIYEPESGYSGESDFTFKVTDSHGASDTAILDISVDEPEVTNQAPTIAADPVTPIAVMQGNVDVTSTTHITASDPDEGDTVSYDMAGWSLNPPFEHWGTYQNHLYVFVASPGIAWDSAQFAAHQYAAGDSDGYMATITNAEESAFILNNVVTGSSPFWIAAVNNSAFTHLTDGMWGWDASGYFSIPHDQYHPNNNAPEAGQALSYLPWAPNHTESLLFPFVAEGTDGFFYAIGNGNGDFTGQIGGYVVEFSDAGNFTHYSLGGTYGRAEFDTATGELKYFLDITDPDTVALTAASHVTDSFNIVVTDNHGLETTKTVTFAIDGDQGNEAPVVNSYDAEVGYTLGEAGVPVDNVIDLSDIDSATLHGATITINNFTVGDTDTLIFANAGSISGSFDSNTGVLTLTGDDTVGNYELALRSISYQNNDPYAPAGDRTISYQVDDGADTSNVATSTIHVDYPPTNEPPVAADDTLSGDLAGFTYNPDNGHWYKINSNEVSWAQARSEALAAGGYLATLTSLAENTFVSALLTNYGGGYAYVGGTDQGAEGVWKWIDGPEAGQEFWLGGTLGGAPNGIFENWQHSEDYPTQYVEPNGGEIENYMYVRGTGEWVDQPGESYPGLYSVIEVSFAEDTVSVIPGAFLLANDSDPDGPTPSINSVSLTDDTHGTVALVDGNIVYTPNANYNGPVNFQYTVFDGTDVSAPATASFSVEAINDAPVLSIENAHTTEEGDSTTLSGLSVSDPDAGDEFDVTIAALHGSLAFVDGDVTGVSFHAILDGLNGVNDVLGQGVIYTNPEEPLPGENDTDMLTLTVTDQNGGTDTLNFIFNVFGEDGVTLYGTAGKDVLFGGEGDHPDTFVFQPDMNHDTIVNFAPGMDQIMLHNQADLETDFQMQPEFDAWLASHTSSVDGGTLLTLDTGSIMLNDVILTSLTHNDFIINPGVN